MTIRNNFADTDAMAVVHAQHHNTLATTLNTAVINLLDYSAAPDGTTSNSAAIAAAVAAAEAGCRRLYIPRMTQPWVFGSSVTLGTSHGIEIFSDPWSSGNSLMRIASGVNDYAFKFDTTRSDYLGNHIVMRNIEIDGNFSGQTTGGGCVLANNPIQSLFDHCHFHHAYDVALYIKGQQGSGPFGHHNRLVNCLFDNSKDSAGSGIGVKIELADENMLMNCDFEWNGHTGPHVLDTVGLNHIIGCVFVGGGEAIRLQDMLGTRVIGCMFDGLGADVVHAVASNCIISGNYFSGNTGAVNTFCAVTSDYGGYNVVSNNVFESGYIDQTLRAFISIGTTSTYNSVAGNVFKVNSPGSLGTGGVLNWNGSSAATQHVIVRSNIGLADTG